MQRDKIIAEKVVGAIIPLLCPKCRRKLQLQFCRLSRQTAEQMGEEIGL